MDPNYANAGGGGGVGIGASAIATAPAATVVPGGRYNAAYYKEPSSLTSCQRSGAPPPPSHPAHYNTYDPYGSSSVSAKLPSSTSASAYPYDAEAEFKERTGMGKATTKILAGNVNSGGAKIQQQQQHAYNQNSCYSYGQSNSVESANYYAYAYEQQQHQYTQQQYHNQHHQSQLHQQYKYNKLVAAQQQQQQQQHSHKIPPPEYGYASYHHPYYHPHYHHQPSSLSSSSSSSSSSSAAAAAAASATSQKGVSMMKTIPPDAGNSSSSMPYGSYSSKMLSARAPQYSASSYYPHPYQPHNTYPMPVVTAGHHQHSTYQQQSQSVCEDSNRWMWNGVAGNGSDYYPNPNGGSCRSGASYSSAYTNGSGGSGAAASKQHHSTMWPPIQYQSAGYHSPSAMVAPNQSCCQPPPQSSTSTFYPQQYVKYSMHQPSITSAVDYNNDLYLNSPQEGGKNSGAATTIVASGKVYTDLSGNSYQQALNNQQQQHQQVAAFQHQQHGELDYNNPRYLQQQQHTESPSPSANSSSTYNHHHHYYHPYPPAYSSNIVEAHHPNHHHHGQVHPETTYQQQVDTKIKSQSLRDFLTSWNEDEDEMNSSTVATDVPGSLMDQMHLSSDHFAQETNSQPVMENHLQFKQSFSATSRPKIHVGITVDSTVESDQYINLPDIIIDIEKSNKDIVSLVDDSLVSKLDKEDIQIKEEMPNTKEEPLDEDFVVDKNNPKTVTQQSIQRENKSRKKCRNSKRFHVRIKQSRHRQHKKLKIVRRKVIRRRRVKKQPTLTLNRLKSLKNLCVSVINSDDFRKYLLDDERENGEPRTDEQRNTPTPNSTSTSVVVVVNGDGQSSNTTKSSVIPKLSDLCKNALNSSFDRDVLVINLDEILDSDNLFVVQCDINENILENFVEQAVQQQQQHDQPENSKIDQAEEAPEAEEVAEVVHEGENLVEILNDSSSSNRLSESNCSRNTNEVSNLPLDKSLEHSNLSSVNPLLATPPLPSSPPPISPSAPPSPLPLPASDDVNGNDGSITCPVAMLLCGADDDDCRGHDHSSPLPLPVSSSIDCGNPTDNNQHEMQTLSEVVQQKQNDIKTFLLPTENATPSSPSQSTAAAPATAFDVTNELLLLESSKVVTTPSIHHEEIVPDNLKKFQNEKFLKYLHAKYVQGNLSEFYHANRIIKKYKKRIIKKLLNIVR